MKFLYYNNKSYTNDFSYNFLEVIQFIHFDYKYDKKCIKNRKILNKIRPGLTKNLLKNSIKRDKNNSFLEQFLNINQKKGKKIKILNSINTAFENFNMVFTLELEEFKRYKNYSNLFNIFDKNFFFSDLNYIFFDVCLKYKSIFEIKSIKNNKKVRQMLKNNSKYTHEIIYIPPERRMKYVLKNLSLYKENFKNYNIWERFFWSFFMTLILNENSFLKKKRDFIYLKSVKFFKLKKKNNISSSK